MNQTELAPSLRDKLRALLGVFLDDSKFDPVTKKLIETLVTGFLKKATDDDIRESILKLRDEIIPFILGNEDTNQVE